MPTCFLLSAFCFIVQGGKRALLGEEVFWYDPGHYLIFTVDLPIIFQVEKASKERPYLGLRLNLDPSLVASVMVESGIETRKGDPSIKAIDVSSIDADMLDAVVRMVRLLDTRDEQKVIAPLVIREIVYRLSAGGQRARLTHLLASAGDTRRIAKAIGHLRENFDKSLNIEKIAREPGMSVSGFHHHFKSVTAMSPLQFQKQIRLQEARRIMLARTWTPRAPVSALAMKIRPTSAASTKSNSGLRRNVTSTSSETASQPRLL